jgi:hypothetical protein
MTSKSGGIVRSRISSKAAEQDYYIGELIWTLGRRSTIVVREAVRSYIDAQGFKWCRESGQMLQAPYGWATAPARPHLVISTLRRLREDHRPGFQLFTHKAARYNVSTGRPSGVVDLRKTARHWTDMSGRRYSLIDGLSVDGSMLVNLDSLTSQIFIHGLRGPHADESWWPRAEIAYKTKVTFTP